MEMDCQAVAAKKPKVEVEEPTTESVNEMCRQIVRLNNKWKNTFDLGGLDYTANCHTTKQFEISDIKWSVSLRRLQDKKLSIDFKCDVSPDQKGWICKLDSKLTVYKQGSTNDHHVENKMCELLVWNRDIISFEIMSRDDYIENKSIHLRFDFDFFFFNFEAKVENYTDVKLKVEETKLYFNKGELSMNSEYFYNLFVGENRKSVRLEDVGLTTFLTMIITIFPMIQIGPYPRTSDKHCSNPFDSVMTHPFQQSDVLALIDRFELKTVKTRISAAMVTVLSMIKRDISNEERLTKKPVEKYEDFYKYIINCLEYGENIGDRQILDLSIECLTKIDDIKIIAKKKRFDSLTKETRKTILTKLIDLL